MEILKVTFLGMSGFIGLITVALITEISSLPSLKTTLTSIMNLPYVVSLSLISSLILISPMLTILIVLSSFKKFVFNHSKNILNSFTRALYTLSISYSAAIILMLIPFAIDLAFREDYYLVVRLSGVYKDNGSVHTFSLNLIMALLGQSAIFSLAFLVTEVLLTYRFQVVSTTIKDFIVRNAFVVMAVTLSALGTILMMYKIECGYEEKYIAEMHQRKGYRVTDNLAEQIIMSIALMYLYALLAIHDN